MNLLINLAEHRLLSDCAIRKGMDKLLKERIAHIQANGKTTASWIRELQVRPLAENTESANEQHYEIPAPYFTKVLGPHLKYSCGYWSPDCDSLKESEVEMLKLTCKRAELADGQRILELGCGWGSLSLWMAENFPNSQIVSVSNSQSQREFIEQQARTKGLTNLSVQTCDINEFEPQGHFDRVVSVEMFEHVRNHRQLFGRIHDWLLPEGKIFVHIFAHREHTYLFEANNSKDWMSKYFFTGGIMPSVELLPQAAEQFTEEARWEVNGLHYSKTLEAWLQKQDASEEEVLKIFKECYGKQAKIWLQRWRMFYMACSELFAFKQGKEWFVMHYRFSKNAS